jgi:hypothetical protein
VIVWFPALALMIAPIAERFDRVPISFNRTQW